MVYLFISIVLFLVFFLLAWGTVFFWKPKIPRKYFLIYILFVNSIYLIITTNTLTNINESDLAAWVCGFLMLLSLCLTFWNGFYSILWGFSGGLLADFVTSEKLRNYQNLISSYRGHDQTRDGIYLDRILFRRIPFLETKKYLYSSENKFFLTSKGAFIAQCTIILNKLFSLGKGGGIVEDL